MSLVTSARARARARRLLHRFVDRLLHAGGPFRWPPLLHVLQELVCFLRAELADRTDHLDLRVVGDLGTEENLIETWVQDVERKLPELLYEIRALVGHAQLADRARGFVHL